MIYDTILLAAESARYQDEISRFIGKDEGLSYSIARFIMNIVDWLLSVFGLGHNQNLVDFLYAAVVLGVAIVVGYAVQIVLLGVVKAIARRKSTDTYRALTKVNFFHKICRVVTPLVFLALISFSLSNHDRLSDFLSKVTMIYIVIVMSIALTALVMAVWDRVNARANKRKLPLGSLAQLAKVIIWVIAAIIIDRKSVV